jgi:hypothetical protein
MNKMTVSSMNSAGESCRSTSKRIKLDPYFISYTNSTQNGSKT